MPSSPTQSVAGVDHLDPIPPHPARETPGIANDRSGRLGRILGAGVTADNMFGIRLDQGGHMLRYRHTDMFTTVFTKKMLNT